ncbi:MAG: hypothetical protein ACE5FC_04820 [Myxococcota bacterium]
MRTHDHLRLIALLFVLLTPGLAGAADASSAPDGAADLSQYGIFYDSYQPSFYTGFAPRAEDPRRLHLHVGRGNQVRMTLVLSDAVLADYARNLRARHRTYRRLIDQGKVKLTQNAGFDAFSRTIGQLDLDAMIAGEADLSPAALRERNLALMEKLNPGRVFRIRIPVAALVRKWAAEITPADRKSLSPERRLELVNLLLPTRLWVTALEPADAKALDDLVGLVPPEKGGASAKSLRQPYLRLLARVSRGVYPVTGDHLAFAEFTAIHPVGTFNSYVTYRGHKIPQYPTPGRRALTYHQRSKTVDHIPKVAVYGYLPWLPYMHVGKRLHNSFHTLWWRMNPGKTGFLPRVIKASGRARHNGRPYAHLWLLSRGPMSHGCTHVNAGHILELREMLPAEPDVMDDVDAFINKSQLFDVFDIDGDLEPEVMGVRYFVAYSLKNKKPFKLRAPTERRPFYDWLYGGELKYQPDGTGRFEGIRDGHFVGRKAVNGREYGAINLYEADYEPEKIQFYEMVDIPFARELRRVRDGHTIPAGS